MRWLVPGMIAATLAFGCRGPRRRTPVPTAPDDEDPRPAPLAAPPPRAPACERLPPEWRVAPAPGISIPAQAIDGVTVVRAAAGDYVAWLDRTTRSLVLSPPHGPTVHRELPAVELTGPEVLSVEPNILVATAAMSPERRSHRVERVRAGAFQLVFETDEAADDGFSMAAVSNARGAWIAWSEPRADGLGVVRTQFLPAAGLSGRLPLPAAPALRDVSPPDQNASDPALVMFADGSVAVIWLALAAMDAGSANQTATDLWIRRIPPDGRAIPIPIRLTTASATRFGVSGIARDGAVWITYRVAGDAEGESLGDGGNVAVLRLDADLRGTRAATVVTDPNAVPTGVSQIVTAGPETWIFWAERRGEAIVTLRRALSADGGALGASLIEAAFDGDVPDGGDLRSGLYAAVRGSHGEPGVARWRCP